jgi:hypothetical protein
LALERKEGRRKARKDRRKEWKLFTSLNLKLIK